VATSIFIPLLLIIGVVVSIIITRSITRPISKLVKTVSSLGTDLSVRVAPSGPNEISFLGETVNGMAESLQSSRASLQSANNRMERELALASQIQASFLPSTFPPSPELELAVFWKSAREVGGDFYAYEEMENGLRGVSVGDVSGKGTPATMAGALAVGLLQAYASNHPRPEVLLSELNRDLCVRLAGRSMNVACCYAIIDVVKKQLTVAHAGCMYPYLKRENSVHEIAARGMPLGAWRGFKYVGPDLSAPNW